MKLSHDPQTVDSDSFFTESRALERWYDAQPAVRRLWGIRCGAALRVVIAIEPTHDNDDVYPVWFANTEVWATELSRHTGIEVELQLYQEFARRSADDASGVLIADLYWRDATL